MTERRPTVPTAPAVHVVIVNFNSGALLGRCLDGVTAQSLPLQVTIVDNASSDNSMAQAGGKGSGTPRIIRNKRNLGLAKAVNQALVNAPPAPYTLLLNPDCVLAPMCLARLLEALENAAVAAMAGPLILNPDGSEQRGCRRELPSLYNTVGRFLGGQQGRHGLDLSGLPLPSRPTPVEAISGACMLIRTCVLEDLGGLDEGYFLHFEDLDLCQRIVLRGHHILFVPEARAAHWQGEGSRSTPDRVIAEKHRSMYRYLRTHLLTGPRRVLSPLAWSVIMGRMLIARLAARLSRRPQGEARRGV